MPLWRSHSGWCVWCERESSWPTQQAPHKKQSGVTYRPTCNVGAPLHMYQLFLDSENVTIADKAPFKTQVTTLPNAKGCSIHRVRGSARLPAKFLKSNAARTRLTDRLCLWRQKRQDVVTSTIILCGQFDSAHPTVARHCRVHGLAAEKSWGTKPWTITERHAGANGQANGCHENLETSH